MDLFKIAKEQLEGNIRVAKILEGGKRITQEEFDQHDCHLSPDDSCRGCEIYYDQFR